MLAALIFAQAVLVEIERHSKGSQSAEDIGFDPKLWIDLMEVLSDTDLNIEALRHPTNLLNLWLQSLQQSD